MLRCLRITLLVLVTATSLQSSAEPGYCAGDGLVPLQLLRAVPLAINEFMASNRSSLQDPQGQFDDWIPRASLMTG